MTGDVDTSPTLANANLATPVTAGQHDLHGRREAVHIAVGDPSTTTLQSVMNSLSSALQTQLQTTDAGSHGERSIVNGQLQLSISGNSAAHTISFDAQTGPRDTSNLAAALGLS